MNRHARSRASISPHDQRIGNVIAGLMLLYAAASLAHFTHNAEFLHDYPNMPGWLSRTAIYAAWCAVAAIGIAGYTAWRRGHTFLGLALVALYAACGFDTLAHYALAGFGEHRLAMHLTIWVEVAAAAMLFAVVVAYLVRLSVVKGR